RRGNRGGWLGAKVGHASPFVANRRVARERYFGQEIARSARGLRVPRPQASRQLDKQELPPSDGGVEFTLPIPSLVHGPGEIGLTSAAPLRSCRGPFATAPGRKRYAHANFLLLPKLRLMNIFHRPPDGLELEGKRLRDFRGIARYGEHRYRIHVIGRPDGQGY